MKVLMVDVDGVLIRTPPGGWSRDLQADLGLPLQVLQSEFFGQHWNDVIVGRARLTDCLGPFLEAHAPHLTASDLMDYWFRRDADLDLDFLAQLEPLREAGVALHLATNQEHERAAFLWKALGMQNRFTRLHYSADLGSAKPEPGFFAAVISRTGFDPSDITLVDDRPDNIAAARQAGWGGLHWDGSLTLAELIAASS